MSAAKCLASLMVVLVAAVCVAHAQERIRMCGRELIRLAVSSCGNSRLRRSILDLDVDRHQHTAHCEYGHTSGVVVTPVSHISYYCLISYRIYNTPTLNSRLIWLTFRIIYCTPLYHSLNPTMYFFPLGLHKKFWAHFQQLVLTPDVSSLLRGPGCLHGGASHRRGWWRVGYFLLGSSLVRQVRSD